MVKITAKRNRMEEGPPRSHHYGHDQAGTPMLSRQPELIVKFGDYIKSVCERDGTRYLTLAELYGAIGLPE